MREMPATLAAPPLIALQRLLRVAAGHGDRARVEIDEIGAVDRAECEAVRRCLLTETPGEIEMSALQVSHAQHGLVMSQLDIIGGRVVQALIQGAQMRLAQRQ